MSKDNQKDTLEDILEETPAVEEVLEVSEPVTETRACVECQGDGIWDGVRCDTCKGSGKIFRDGMVVSTQDGTYLSKGGKYIKQ